MKYSSKTDRGKVRKINQDTCFVEIFDDNSCVALVCDGMGGSKAGEVASEMAVEIISTRVVGGWRSGISVESVINLLTTAVTAANICIYDKSLEDSKYEGMGTTLVAAVITAGKLIVAHVGDSRAYIVNSAVRRITKDHSLVQDMVDAGEITPEEAVNHPHKNYITRALGVEETVEIDFSEYSFAEDDKLLLCSDGLSNYVNEDILLNIFNLNPIDVLAERLVEEANLNGGGDNVTAVVISE